ALDPYLSRQYDLLIAGQEMEPGLAGRLQALAASLGVGSQVSLLGFASVRELSSLYHGASAYVSLSEREAFPLTPAEALLAGVPVILSAIDPFRELYGQWATIVDSQDPLVLGGCLLRAASG